MTPRYFFHIKYGNSVIVDEKGICLHDLDSARFEVIECLREILSDARFAHEDVDGQKLEIVDEGGETVLSIPF